MLHPSTMQQRPDVSNANAAASGKWCQCQPGGGGGGVEWRAVNGGDCMVSVEKQGGWAKANVQLMVGSAICVCNKCSQKMAAAIEIAGSIL